MQKQYAKFILSVRGSTEDGRLMSKVRPRSERVNIKLKFTDLVFVSSTQ